ncbi:MAG: PAS domain S-box protein [Acidobacteria bacterium]|nr:PAS domain S-box protein [Acidobacteriota bacterium]
MPYEIAILGVLAAFLWTLLVAPLSSDRTPFPLLYASVIIASWFGGFRPGLLATLLASGVSYALLVGSLAVFHPQAAVSVGVFLCTALLSSWLMSAQGATHADGCPANEARLRELFDNATDIVYTHDLSGRFTALNKAGERITGYSRAEALAMRIEQMIAPEHVDLVRRVIAEKLADGGRATTYTVDLIAKDGHRVTVEVSSWLLHANGRPTGVEGIARDIGRRRRSEAQYWGALRMETVGQLAGGVAHDFNNLLTGILGYSELLLERMAPDDPNRADVIEIQKAGESAASLTRQLLAFSRRQVLRPVPMNVNAVISRIENMLRRLIGENIELTMMLDPTVSAVKVDPAQLEQVILNIGINARDAMPNGGTLRIQTSNVHLTQSEEDGIAIVPGHYVQLAISDSGIGMNAQTRSRIFEPFFTTKERGKGTGLGLSTVYGIVKQSGGYIWVASAPGEGTAFRIQLPSIESVPLEPGPQESRPVTTGTETILLAEDEDGLRRIMKRALTMSGYRVLEAQNGEEAVRLAEQHHDDIPLLITDVIMPGMTGRDVADWLMPLRPEMRVLYISGYSEDAISRHGVLSAQASFLQKPFTPQQLLQRIREMLDGAPTVA